MHVTAGDDGLGAGTGGRKRPYYLARENGALNAIRFMADADKTPIDNSAGTMLLNGHAVFRVSFLNTIAYFLRAAGRGHFRFGILQGLVFSLSSASPPEK